MRPEYDALEVARLLTKGIRLFTLYIYVSLILKNSFVKRRLRVSLSSNKEGKRPGFNKRALDVS